MVDLMNIDSFLNETMSEINKLEEEARLLIERIGGGTVEEPKQVPTSSEVLVLNGKFALETMLISARMLDYTITPMKVEAPGDARALIAQKCQQAVSVLRDTIRSLEINSTSLLTLATFIKRKEER